MTAIRKARFSYAQGLGSRSFTKAMDPRLEQSPPGAPETLTGSASQEGSRRLLRSQPRRLGLGQPRQARPRQDCANIPWGPKTEPQNQNFLLWRE